MKTAVLQFRLDEDLKTRAESIFANIGLDTPSAMRLFLKQVVNRGRLPFSMVKEDPFYSEENQKRLKESIAQMEAGKCAVRELVEV